MDRWAVGSDIDEPTPVAGLEDHADGRTESMKLFREGLRLYQRGDLDPAVASWREALALDPGNYIIRKQIWAVENPDRFYTGEVDYAWQREQTAKGG